MKKQPVSTRWDVLERGEGPGGVLWSHAGDQLNANVVDLAAGDIIGEHRNEELDVFVVVLAGGGTITIDGSAVALDRALVHVPAGATRSITAGAFGVRYASIHRRRGALSVKGASK